MFSDRLQKEVFDLPRNDAERAEGLARAIQSEVGHVPATTMHYLWMLQDDPADFVGRVRDVKVKPDGAR